jgi:hypothetical protein
MYIQQPKIFYKIAIQTTEEKNCLSACKKDGIDKLRKIKDRIVAVNKNGCSKFNGKTEEKKIANNVSILLVISFKLQKLHY